MYLANTAELQLYASGRTTGMVVDSGASVTHIVPIYEGTIDTDAIQKTNLGGQQVTKKVIQMYETDGVENGRLDPETGHPIKEIFDISLKTARDIKHQHIYVSEDYILYDKVDVEKINHFLSILKKENKISFIRFMKDYNTRNLWTTFKNLEQKEKRNINLINSMRHYDHTVNVLWVMEHFNSAKKYLDGGKKSAEATGGSDWKKYMHPQYQKRVFFPELWTEHELTTWGIENLENHKILTKLDEIKIN